MRRLLPLLLLAAALLALAPAAGAKPRAAANANLVVGIADQKPDFLTDQRFLSLGMKHARYAVAWDAMRTPWQVQQLDGWLHAAQSAGVTPLLVFSQSRIRGRTRVTPTPQQLVKEFRAIRARYPWVTEFSAWNEANYCGQPTCKKPALVARYWKALEHECRECKVLAADLLDLPSMTTWVRQFTRAAGREPRYWGVHNYISANRFQTGSTKQLLAATKGEIWLTEIGGLVARRNGSPIKLKEGKRHAADVTRFIFTGLAPLSPRIARAYLYQWNSVSDKDSWDSSFIGPDGRTRPALAVLQGVLTGLKKKR